MSDRGEFFEDIEVGAHAPAREHRLTRTDLVMYAGASQDYNPLHHDDTKAQAAGMPSVFGHGMFSAGLLATALTDYVGIGNLRRFQVRFTRQSWPGDVLSTEIVVRSKDETERLVELDCRLLSDSGAVVVEGSATAAPHRRP
ncbi:MaoC family dehydratase [Frankia gtarii]|uniref:MaoC family dehydratase n=1 Tax=Frankia gtarii TaxID=2950102 RepID=UPI0021C0CC75|nr:MaoC/PaaZ C-terminal domain-containing protein [Frankia gtarii]